jgi:hypothetical protein
LFERLRGARIVAFSQYEATVHALARELRSIPGIAVLSGKGARIASGPIARAELLRQFDAANASRRVHSAMNVRLLLTTDLLSEGVNLHNAEVVVHLDLPWTAARLEQRVGRLSRVGSPHKKVHVFGFAPPIELDTAQRNVSRIRAKLEAARRRFGGHTLLARDGLVRLTTHAANRAAHSSDHEAVLALFSDWLGDHAPELPIPFVAHLRTHSGERLALAVVRCAGGYKLVALRRNRVTMHPHVVLHVAQQLTTAEEFNPVHTDHSVETLRRFNRFIAQQRAASSVLPGPAAVALRSAIARAARVVSRSDRPRALACVAAIRTALQRVNSAGDLTMLSEGSKTLLEQRQGFDALAWLEFAKSALLTAFPARPGLAQASEHRLIGILMST